MSSSKIIKLLRANGWVLVSISGSHHTFKKVGCNDIVTVPHPKKDIPIGTLKSIQKKSALKF